MPLTPKGRKIMSSMEKQYGEKKGEKVFYASRSAKKIKGVDPESGGDLAAERAKHKRIFAGARKQAGC
jgi:hypothetical protein